MKCDFSMHHYREIIGTALTHGYSFVGFDEAATIPSDQKVCIMRHDVDYLPERTLDFGKIERDLGIRSTFFFQVCAKTYNLREATTYQIVDALRGMGHTLGLHFDLTWNPDTEWETVAERCQEDKVVFKSITGVEPCDIISFHNPHRFVDRILNQAISGMRHTYERAYFSDMKYVSDSQGWYEACPCQLFAQEKYPVVQLVTHADYWSHATAGDFIRDMAQLVQLRSDDLTQYMVDFHPVCRRHEERLRDEIKALGQMRGPSQE
ncbi:MAG TPA: hypothetical protein VNJ02_04835 [Vicinamibacterales bacterium]|nr:hypothetical protein [Vicinamibacterales bacterium]